MKITVKAKMFFHNGQETLAWLQDRKYVEEAKDYAEPASRNSWRFSNEQSTHE